MSQALLRQRVVLVRSIPAVRTKVAYRYPTLVNIHDVCAFWVDLDHFASVQVSKDSVLFRVANVCDPLHTTVTEAKLLLHNSDNWSKRYLRSSVFARFKLDLLGVPDAQPGLACWMNCTDDACLFSFLSQFRLSLLQEETLTLLQVLEQIVDSLHLDVEQSRNFITSSSMRCNKLDNLQARIRVDLTKALAFSTRMRWVVSWIEVSSTSFWIRS